MKKLFLLAILLGLSGCGDNNQNDTSQSDTQTTQLQTTELAAPTVTNYNLTASSLMMTPAISPLGGWSITNSTVMGASTLIDAVKDSRVSAALVTPNAKQVAEVLRGGVAGIALSIAVNQLLDTVDWVLDPANNQIRYKVINYDQQYRYSNSEVLEYTGIQYIYTIAEAENAFKKFFSVIKRDYIFVGCNINPKINNRIDCIWGYPNEIPSRVVPFSPSKNPDYGEKNLPLEAVAEQVISNADTGSLDAQVATNTATQNILNDVVQAEPVVQELENNANDRCREHNSYQNGKASLIEGRYNEMFIDVHNLYRDYRALRPTHPDGWGTWQGHINKYKEEQQNLNAIIVDAILDGCPETERANRWKKKENPPKPSIHSPG